MPARPVWRGQIRLALVSIPVEIYPATKSGAQIQFHQVHEPTGKRIKYEKVVPGVGPVDRDESHRAPRRSGARRSVRRPGQPALRRVALHRAGPREYFDLTKGVLSWPT